MQSSQTPSESQPTSVTPSKSSASSFSVKKPIDVNGFRIESRIRELEKEYQLAHQKMNQLIHSKQELANILTYAQILINLSKKIAKWNEVKSLYELNVKVNLFESELTLHELQRLASELEPLILTMDNLATSAATSGDSGFELSSVYLEFRRQKRIYEHYIGSIQIAKTQIGTFELDSSLLDD